MLARKTRAKAPSARARTSEALALLFFTAFMLPSLCSAPLVGTAVLDCG